MVEVHARMVDEEVLIEVHDNGPGIPKKYEVTIWERFERGAQTYLSQVQGSGLGLAIARQLVHAHKGHTGHGPSTRLGGACFWLTVAAAELRPAGHRELVGQSQPLA
jgi:signal transduction histidine kinase